MLSKCDDDVRPKYSTMFPYHVCASRHRQPDRLDCTPQKVRLAVIWGAPEHQVQNPHEVAHPLHLV